MLDHEKMYRVLADCVDLFFAFLEKEDAVSAVETLMRGRMYCLECEAAENNGAEPNTPENRKKPVNQG